MKELILKSGWLQIDKSELDALRKSIREVYELEGGGKKFNSHLENYEELREIIKAKLQEFRETENIEIKINDQVDYEILPGNTFFRNLLYTNRFSENLRFQEYNIEICYLFAYGKKRFDYLRHEKNLKTVAQLKSDTSLSEPRDVFNDQFQLNSKNSEYKFIVSSTLNNMIEADKIIQKLRDNFGFKVESETGHYRSTLNSQVYNKGSLEDIYGSLDDNTIIISVISRDYLQNESCVRDLINFTNNNLDLYLTHTFHILLDDIYEGDFNIFDSLGRSELLKYWKLRSEKLEENHKLILGVKSEMIGNQQNIAPKNKRKPPVQEIFMKLSEELKEIKNIIVELNRVLDIIRANDYKILYKIFLTRISSSDSFIKILPKPAITNAKLSSGAIDFELERVYKSIKIPSANNPKKPEFPPLPFYKPRFPASDTFRINVPGFKNVWLKDESTNPTGTHKDRLAWEVVIKYKSLIEGMKYKEYLPQMSIISSGSAAIAIQHFLNLFEIPVKLKVLVDYHLNAAIKEFIKKIGCELYVSDLSKKLLTSDEIKDITDNRDGIDITYRETLDPNQDNYYDWMSYEILKENADYCFVPFGTGDLFINILNIVKLEYFNSFIGKHDPRFFGNLEIIKKCQFLGASSDRPDTALDKLYSNFLPSISSFKKYIEILKNDYSCVGNQTGFYYVNEKFVESALEIASSHKNLKFEPSGMAGLALLLQMSDSIDHESKILIVNTGKTKTFEELQVVRKNVKHEI